MSRLLAYGFGLGVVALVAAPGFRDPVAGDDYPLSTYPMFARPRGKPWLSIAEGVDADGNAVRLEPALIANDELMQAVATVERAVDGGPRALAPFCAGIAARIAARPDYARVVRVRIVRARFDPVRYFT